MSPGNIRAKQIADPSEKLYATSVSSAFGRDNLFAESRLAAFEKIVQHFPGLRAACADALKRELKDPANHH